MNLSNLTPGQMVEVTPPDWASTVKKNESVVMLVGADRAFVYRKVHARGADVEQTMKQLFESDAPLSIGLDPREVKLLEASGLKPLTNRNQSALDHSRRELDFLLSRGSLSLEQAAERLKVTPSRLRQRLAAQKRTLYGIKEDRAWRIPKFQFERSGKQVRNIDKVVQHIRLGAHPLTVKSWFTTPHQDLVMGKNDRRISPLQWLSTGMPVPAVAQLAKEI